MRKTALLTILFVALLTKPALADSSVYCNLPYAFFYSAITEMIYLGCNYGGTSFELVTIEPVTSNEISRYPIDGSLCGCGAVDDGLNLVLILSHTDLSSEWNTGKIQKINTLTGEPVIESEYELNDNALDLEIDHTNGLAYVCWGAFEQGYLGKFSTTDCQIIGNEIKYGVVPENISLTNDGAKLYVNNTELYHIDEPELITYWEIGIFDTSNMELSNTIRMDILPEDFEMGTDNRLYISYDQPYEEYDHGKSLYVINTLTDQIDYEIQLENDKGIWDLAMDPINNRLYGSVCPRDEYDSGMDSYIHCSSNEIVWFDLSDPLYTSTFFTLGDENLWDIAVAYTIGSSKIFAIAEDTANVYYMDL